MDLRSMENSFKKEEVSVWGNSTLRNPGEKLKDSCFLFYLHSTLTLQENGSNYIGGVHLVYTYKMGESPRGGGNSIGLQ